MAEKSNKEENMKVARKMSTNKKQYDDKMLFVRIGYRRT